MPRAPYVLTATAAATAALVAFHPHATTTTVAATSTPTAASSTGSSSSSSSSASGTTYDGAVESNRYGNVQVKITVANGKLTAVTAEQLPENDPRSAQISSYAEPVLRQEALSAQSASINAVSGASYTSASYEASLQTALTKANL